MDREDDRALLERAAQGDLGAFDVFVRRWETALHRFLVRLTGPRLADDARQQTFVRIYTRAAGYRGGSVRSWVFQVAYSVGMDALRADRRRQSISGELPPDLPVRAAGPAETALRRDDHRAVRAALDALPPEQRLLVWLRAAEGLRFTEIAAALDVPPATVRHRFGRALRKLRFALGVPADCGSSP